jgi:hypothetical protein
MRMRSHLLLGALAVLAAVVQLIATRWGIAGVLAGGLLCGITVVSGAHVLQMETEPMFAPVIAAVVASLAGLLLGVEGAGVRITGMAWVAPLIAAIPATIPVVIEATRGARCPLCHTRLHSLLAFVCPRCHLKVCENCWQFERGRCHLCEANQVALFPLDLAWWQERFKRQAREGRCALCMRTTDWEVAHWPCGGCGHSQCRLCWDDNNGQCSRCGWTMPGLPEDVREFVAAGLRPAKTDRRA